MADPTPSGRAAAASELSCGKIRRAPLYGCPVVVAKGKVGSMSAIARGRRTPLPRLLSAHAAGRKLSMLTAYDSLTAPIFERAGVDMLLVGDSYGNVMLGYQGTLQVTLPDMVRATESVARSTDTVFIVADLPFGTYEVDEDEAFRAAKTLIQAGAQAVKVEGAGPVVSTVKTLTDAGIAVMGHLGYTPQSEHALGGPRMQGRGDARQKLLADALALQEAGAFALVLEMVPADVAEEITRELSIPTIGIGAGPDCDGQVLVWSDMAGMTDWTPSFVHRFAELGAELQQAAHSYHEAVVAGQFPTSENFKQN